MPQGKKTGRGLKEELKDRFPRKELREGIKGRLQGQEARGAKDQLRGQDLEVRGAKDQLRGQEVKEGTQDDQLQDYMLVEPGESLWASAPIEEPVGETNDSR